MWHNVKFGFTFENHFAYLKQIISAVVIYKAHKEMNQRVCLHKTIWWLKTCVFVFLGPTDWCPSCGHSRTSLHLFPRSAKGKFKYAGSLITINNAIQNVIRFLYLGHLIKYYSSFVFQLLSFLFAFETVPGVLKLCLIETCKGSEETT